MWKLLLLAVFFSNADLGVSSRVYRLDNPEKQSSTAGDLALIQWKALLGNVVSLDAESIEKCLFQTTQRQPLRSSSPLLSSLTKSMMENIKSRLLIDPMVQQQVIGTMARDMCGLFGFQVYNPITNTCQSYSAVEMRQHLSVSPYLVVTGLGEVTLNGAP